MNALTGGSERALPAFMLLLGGLSHLQIARRLTPEDGTHAAYRLRTN